MTTHDKDKIIAAMKECYHPYSEWNIDLEKFYAIAFEAGRQAEREKCANVCEEIRVIVDGNHQWTALHVQDQCIKAIRARGDMK